ncbi:hypothetical protein ASD11_01045 [Aeromicrobium sp. Root495]|uniref:DUF6314 family protein n=1 Tax=Aeromicrobium sp. Root495 TaxID=1736550 RepID=UPI0006F2E83D|nr:DUF6314 family protein [Aeromicrobium sp. Root495]KQY58283.1 hypothetical protein ASD11_01045 [Aeromicrobium sp. Root495]
MTSPLDLLGTWTLERTIDDRASGEARSVAGSTHLSLLDDGRVRWDESGVMRWAAHEVPVSRTLFVEQRGDDWFVTFEDGRDFHPWSTETAVDHDCPPDVYTGAITVHGAGAEVSSWSVTWTARGPAKDYTMVSLLSRAE